MATRKKQDGFNLAFLDVMACGLGAVLMILIVVKFNADDSASVGESARLQQELAGAKGAVADIERRIENVDRLIASASTALESAKQRIDGLGAEQAAAERAMNNQQTLVSELQQSIATADKQADDRLRVKGTGEENYLLGLKVEGRHIGILLDSSASMTDEGLIAIIRHKIGTDQSKKNAPKWLRTKRIARWLLARLPESSQVTAVAFNETASVLGARDINHASESNDIEQLAADIDALVPEKGTNLQQGLIVLKKAMPALTDLYVVTDGLPTLLNQGSGFKETRHCKPVSRTTKTINGDCRMQVFAYTLKNAAPKEVTTHVILLPLEGDPQAPAAYWHWSDSSGGLMISPAGSWP